MTRLALFVALLPVAPVLAAPVPKAKLPEVEVLPMATALLPGERLMVFVRFTNRERAEVFQYESRFGDLTWGTTVLEVRGPSDDEFRRPYDLAKGLEAPEARKKGEGIAPGRTLDSKFRLPCVNEEKEHPVFHEAGEWQVRARVLLHGGVEKASEAVTITVAERTVDEMKKFRAATARIDRLWEDPNEGWGEKCRELQKLTDALDPSYTADKNRSDILILRLCLIRSGGSKESREDVLRDVDAHWKTLPPTARTYLCVRVAAELCRREEKANTLESLALARKYLERADGNIDSRDYLLKIVDEEEKTLKAKPPEKK